jgi:hypothetical protein
MLNALMEGVGRNARIRRQAFTVTQVRSLMASTGSQLSPIPNPASIDTSAEPELGTVPAPHPVVTADRARARLNFMSYTRSSDVVADVMAEIRLLP